MREIIIFLVLALCIIGLGNVAVSASVVSILYGLGLMAIERWLVLTMYIVPFIGTFAFIGSIILGNKYYNFVTRYLSIKSGVWMGLYVNFFLSACLYSLSLYVVTPLQATWFGICLFALSFLAGMYGLVHARLIKTKHIEVTLPNLPASWRGRKAVFVSDVHLGQILNKRFAERVVKAVNAVHPDIVFVGGDLYDGSLPSAVGAATPFQSLKAPLGTYFVTGNHEEFRHIPEFRDLVVKEAGLTLLSDEKIEVDGVDILAVDHRHGIDRKQFADILQSLAIDRNRPNILLKHEPNAVDVSASAGISLQLSGHTHRAQQWPLGYIPRLIFKGYDYGLNRLDDLQIYTSSGVGTFGPPLRFGTDSEIVVIHFR